MPRQARFLPPKNVFHIMCRGNNGNTVFREPEDYAVYLELFERFKKDHPFNLFHYCLMPSHVHQLIETLPKSDYSVFMKRLSLSYFCYYRDKYGWKGHFWQDRFKSKLISKDDYLIQCGKYIELNAVRGGLVKNQGEWQWCSYKTYADGQKNRLITTDPIYESLGATDNIRQIAYQKMVLLEIFDFDNKAIGQGTEEFLNKAQRRAKFHQDKTTKFHSYPEIRQK